MELKQSFRKKLLDILLGVNLTYLFGLSACVSSFFLCNPILIPLICGGLPAKVSVKILVD